MPTRTRQLKTFDKRNGTNGHAAFSHVVCPTDAPAVPLLYTARQVAEILSCHPKTVSRLALRGQLPRVILNSRSVRYRASDVNRLIETSTVTIGCL
jgi:predicted DNA-binding transcriptional regulator AlpA